ncbi:class B sortase [Candidatus Saccharibacteria bacterium]|nr:class B sortase [Candidatus Saccharibacteria bacterium]
MLKKILSQVISVIDVAITIIASLVFLGVIALGGFALYDAVSVVDSANLGDDVLRLRPSRDDGGDFSLKDLKQINGDIVGWIKVDNTNIDYPILQSTDNSEYLNLDYKKEYAAAGSIILDYRNRSFLDDYSILYGHHMSKNRMFSDVARFEDADFFENNGEGRVYAEEGVYRLKILAYAEVSAFDLKVYGLSALAKGENDAIVQYFQSKAKRVRSDIGAVDKIVILSTCDDSVKANRDVALGALELISDGEAEIDGAIDKDIESESDGDSASNQVVEAESSHEKEARAFPVKKVALTIMFIGVVGIFIKLVVDKLR